ncbi:OmpA family protein [Aquabacterium sp. A08]|uniref:OmpA family protein n=1 Tax=Aquabacterium sp. A08 TaxID=2718532 RepID=UPI001420D6CE|nr:OmpA family protein [Aquabacterium sp. A08]NIC40846.1 OmpA family protein [Aquabacterium sp. A08]
MTHTTTFFSTLPGRTLALALTFVAAATLSACGGMPQSNAQLDQARRDYGDVRKDPRAQGYAGEDLQRATDALARANATWNESASEAQVNHLSYLASQRAAIVLTNLDTRVAQDALDAAEARRRSVQLDARTQEADAAQRITVAAQQATQAAQRDTAAAERDAAAARSASTQAQRQTQAALERNRQLEARLKDLNARPTPRGLVVTLGDVLFDVDSAALGPGGQRLVQQLAAVLNEFPQRNALIEGHTDSSGSDAHSQALSTQRADAVWSALLQQGIAGARISARGYGESTPVSGNETAAGRQMNRRVEIVLSDDNGQISTR